MVKTGGLIDLLIVLALRENIVDKFSGSENNHELDLCVKPLTLNLCNTIENIQLYVFLKIIYIRKYLITYEE